jgi:hypothetical protein
MIKIGVSISKLLDDVAQAYIDDQIKKGIFASGKSASEMRPVATETEGTLYGSGYWYQLKHGRKPGKFPPIDMILEWIRVKQITPRDNKTTERQLAFLFARKIAQKGTNIFQKRSPAIDVDAKVKALTDKFLQDISRQFKGEITQSLK